MLLQAEGERVKGGESMREDILQTVEFPGLYDQLDIGHQTASACNAKAKIIERFFRDFGELEQALKKENIFR